MKAFSVNKPPPISCVCFIALLTLIPWSGIVCVYNTHVTNTNTNTLVHKITCVDKPHTHISILCKHNKGKSLL